MTSSPNDSTNNLSPAAEHAMWKCFSPHARGVPFEEFAPFYARIRTNIGSFLSNLAFGILFLEGIPLWFDFINKDVLIVIYIILTLLLNAFFLLLVHRAYKRLYQRDNALQQLTYVCVRKAMSRKQNALTNLCEAFCQNVVPLFEARARNGTIGSAIRMRFGDSWVTLAHGGKQNARRDRSSVPLKDDGELMMMLKHKKAEGYDVFFCNDVDAAHENKVLEDDPNANNEFASEVKSMMIARIRTYDRATNKLAMTGILYISSSEKNHFKGADVDLMLAAADLFGLCASRIVEEEQYVEKKTKE